RRVLFRSGRAVTGRTPTREGCHVGSTDRGTGRDGSRGGLAFGAAAGTRYRRHLRRDRLLWGGAVELLGADGDGVGDVVGHWSFAVRNDVHYRSRLALVVIGKTPLRWAIPRYWQLRRQR